MQAYPETIEIVFCFFYFIRRYPKFMTVPYWSHVPVSTNDVTVSTNDFVSDLIGHNIDPPMHH